jgi:hypothetical protein
MELTARLTTKPQRHRSKRKYVVPSIPPSNVVGWWGSSSSPPSQLSAPPWCLATSGVGATAFACHHNLDLQACTRSDAPSGLTGRVHGRRGTSTTGRLRLSSVDAMARFACRSMQYLATEPLSKTVLPREREGIAASLLHGLRSVVAPRPPPRRIGREAGGWFYVWALVATPQLPQWRSKVYAWGCTGYQVNNKIFVN